MKKHFFLSILLGLTINVHAQTSSTNAANTLSSFSKQDEIKALTSNKMRNVTEFDNRYEGVKGTPFMFDDWSEGSILLNDSAQVTTPLLYKFDGINNELWVKMKTGPERILFNKELLSFEILRPQGQKIKFKKVKLPESLDRHHFVVSIFEGNKISFVKDYKKVFRKSNLVDRGIVTTGNAYDWFEEVNTFYIKKNDKEYSKLNLKKGDIIDALKLSRPATESVEKYCKTNGLKGKMTEEEAIKLLNYVESLLE